MAQYEDPKTKNLYPSQEWMFENIKNLPEVQKAYPDYGKPGNLGNTLPPETGETQITPTIPKGSIDNLTAMRILMRGISEKAYSKRMGAGLGTITGGLEEQGLGLEGMSGNITSRIINFVENQTRPGIESKLTTMKDIIDGIGNRQAEQRQMALTQLDLVLSTPGAILKLDEDALTGIANTTGIDVESLTAIQDAEKTNEALRLAKEVMPDRTQVVEVSVDGVNRKQLIDLNTGNVIKDLGESGGTDTSKQDMYFMLSGKRGTDGYISPEDWQVGLNAWLSAGLDLEDFVDNFKVLVNPEYQSDYKGMPEF